ncbi:MAG: hypothetical protein D3908_12405, partial [Candidatus Electrothrix sp. AUS4]|nr:hypothetical protein [Candidatus Electrothrix sp. AUS4]
MNSFIGRLTDQLQALSGQGVRRKMLSVQPTGSAFLQHQDVGFLNLASNDYLGLAGDKVLLQSFYVALGQQPYINMVAGIKNQRLILLVRVSQPFFQKSVLRVVAGH